MPLQSFYMDVSNGILFLAQQGINLYACIDLATLPDAIRAALLGAGLELGRYQRLVLLGNGGKGLWPAIQAHGMAEVDPVDSYSVEMAERFVEGYLDGVSAEIIYPAGPLIPLQQIGKLAGWHHDSPLGLGISAKWGVWFAYRVAVLVNAPLPLVQEPPSQSPCDTCIDKPCMSACPVQAVRGVGRFDIGACSGHRNQPGSGCADRCLSRLACPVAPEHRYPIEQVQYHYAQSLASIKAWAAKAED